MLRMIVLNGPLGIGKSTLAEALCESIERCMWLDGDRLIAANPPPPLQHLHSTITLLIAHNLHQGYRTFVIDYIWPTPADLADLRRALSDIATHTEIHCFLLILPVEENLRRIERRQTGRAIHERDFELRTVAAEREALSKFPAGELGEPFDVSAQPHELVAAMKRRFHLDAVT